MLLRAVSRKPRPEKNERVALSIRRTARRNFGIIQKKMSRKTTSTTAMITGAKTARIEPIIAMPSSINDKAQFETGSGERFAVARSAAFVPCEEKAKPPPSKQAMTETDGSRLLVAA